MIGGLVMTHGDDIVPPSHAATGGANPEPFVIVPDLSDRMNSARVCGAAGPRTPPMQIFGKRLRPEGLASDSLAHVDTRGRT